MFSYAIADFLAYDRAIWLGMVSRYLAAWWWVGAAACVVLVLAVKHWLREPAGGRPRFLFLVLAASWVWIAWQFHWHEHRSLNWAAGYWAVAFAIQGALLLLTAIFFGGKVPVIAPKHEAPDRSFYRRLVWLAVASTWLLPGIMGWWIDSIPFPGLEWYGLTPDATAFMTLILLALLRNVRLWIKGALAIIPVLSLAVSSLFGISLQIRSTAVLVLIGVVVVVVLLRVLWLGESQKTIAG